MYRGRTYGCPQDPTSKQYGANEMRTVVLSSGVNRQLKYRMLLDGVFLKF